MSKYCIYQYPRMRNKQPYLYCKNKSKQVTYIECKNCQKREIKRNKPIKKKTNKLAAKERKRYSIIQKDTDKCFICNRQVYLDKHEAFGGSNRLKSMEWGLIYYLCRQCHSLVDTDKVLRQKLHNLARETFIENYTKDKFLEEFKKMYMEE